MNLWEIQPFVKDRIDAHPQFLSKNVKAIIDDGTYPKLPGLEAALRNQGLALIVWRIGSHGLVDAAKSGVSDQLLNIAVVIQENEAVNRSPSGTGILPEQALQYVFETVSGYPKGTPPGTPIMPYQDAFENLGKVNGVLTIVANFAKQHRITPI